jgi:hypothetical protein
VHNLNGVVRSHRQLLRLYESVEQFAVGADVRLFGTYYRVGFYGKLFGGLNGAQYVYKEPLLTQLSEIKQRLVRQYTEQTGKPVQVFKSSSPVDREQFCSQDDPWLQITALKAAADFGDAEDKSSSSKRSGSSSKRAAYVSRVTRYERENTLRALEFDTPFTLSGSARGAITEQHMRTTRLSVAQPFPWLQTRQRVIRVSDRVRTPIQCVIKDVLKRISRLQEEIWPRAGALPQLKTMNQVLSGSVNMQVHGGSKEVANAFLQSRRVREQFNVRDVEHLRALLSQFLALCGQALEVAAELVSTDNERAFQEVLENGYEDLMSSVLPLLEQRLNDDDDVDGDDDDGEVIEPSAASTSSEAKGEAAASIAEGDEDAKGADASSSSSSSSKTDKGAATAGNDDDGDDTSEPEDDIDVADVDDDGDDKELSTFAI